MGFFVFWASACLGSFINVVAYRLPREESVVRPGSRCPRCKAPIAFYDNVPILAWALLGGRCRRCRGRISPRYPAVELVMGGLGLALWLRWQAAPVWAAAAILGAGALVALSLIDWDTFIIPDELSLGLLALGLAAAPLSPYFPGPWYLRLGASFLGALLGLGIGWGTAAAGERLFKKEALGGGDIKLMAAVGAWQGCLGAFDCMMVSSFIGALYGLSQMMSGRLRRSDPIPFGPFLSGGALFNFFYLLPFGFPFS